MERILLERAGLPVILAMVFLAFVLLGSALAKPGKEQRLLGILGAYAACVLFAILAARSVDWYIEARIRWYNPRDDWWMNTQVPEGYEYLLNLWIQDTGRAMVYFTAPVLTPFLLVFAYLLILIRRLFTRLVAR